MRLFQNSGLYPTYRKRLYQLTGADDGFAAQRDIFLGDRYGAPHFLKPVLDGDPTAFFTNGDDVRLQRAWAREQGMRSDAKIDEILLAQIEAHRADVFYNLDPMRYGNAFLKRLPSCVKRTVAWRAAPSAGGDFTDHQIILNNFPTLLEGYRRAGMRAEYFTPAHDPVMDQYAANQNRPVDILFVGGYSRHHKNRAKLLESVATLRDRYKIIFHLDRSRMTRLAETPAGWLGPLAPHRRPRDIRAVSAEPVFGVDLYSAISQAKIVINGAVDMAGPDRGNMRCWEAMGCGAMLLSDCGTYPAGMIDGRTFLAYASALNGVARLIKALGDSGHRNTVVNFASKMVTTDYSKTAQWHQFLNLCD
jgi:hypothetical protein